MLEPTEDDAELILLLLLKIFLVILSGSLSTGAREGGFCTCITVLLDVLGTASQAHARTTRVACVGTGEESVPPGEEGKRKTALKGERTHRKLSIQSS